MSSGQTAKVNLPNLNPTATTPWQNLFTTTRLTGLIVTVVAFSIWLIVAEVTIASINYLQMKWDNGITAVAVLGAGHVAGILLLIGLYLFRQTIMACVSKAAEKFGNLKPMLYLLTAVALVRIAWIILVPTGVYSDSTQHITLAQNLLEHGEYFSGTRAYWAPGYPVLLAGVFFVFGNSLAAAKCTGLALACLTELLCWIWVKRYAGKTAAGLVLLILVLWPTRTLHLDILSYEDLVTTTIIASLAIMPDIRNRRICWWRWILAGLILGYGIISRAPVALVVVAVFAWMLLERVTLRRAILVTGVYTFIALLPLVPWTIRNYYVFDKFVPLTTNAGINLYHSYSPGGNGTFYAPAHEEVIAAAGGGQVDEYTYNVTAMQLTWQVIRENPMRAVYRTLISKPAHYLGSDNGVAWLEWYEAIWPDRTIFPKILKSTALFFCNSYYLVIMLCPLLLLRKIKESLVAHPAAAAAFMIFFSGFVVHSVFLAVPRYHMIYTPFWAICLAILLVHRWNVNRTATCDTVN